jgi:hypothetical protein
MPRKPSVSARVTAYQLDCQLDAAAAIRHTYLSRPNFSVHEVTIGGPSSHAPWADLAATAITTLRLLPAPG